MKHTIEAIDACILYSEGVNKALAKTNGNKIFLNKYNKGYYDATKDLIAKLNGIRSVLSEELDAQRSHPTKQLTA